MAASRLSYLLLNPALSEEASVVIVTPVLYSGSKTLSRKISWKMTTNIELTFPQSNDLLSVLITFHSDGDHGREGPDFGGAHLHLEEVHGREGPDLEGAHLHLVEVVGAIQFRLASFFPSPSLCHFHLF